MGERAVDPFRGYGPQCAFCRTSVPANASVCASCGARKGSTGENSPGILFMALALLFALGVGIFMLWTIPVGYFIPYFTGGSSSHVPIWSWVVGSVVGLILVPVGLSLFAFCTKIVMYPFTQPRWRR